ncbi:SIMPL domain-containing protein [Paenibacillus koleovorans]|uniref:SIMPL domain-containing protein n=1 Tax=Paenibacillus koleovorans TaxID=121608 RepID=UPI000FDAC36E|nr:SIMPL domain-containing protein [Paenibacillus koleovorans]
MIHPYGMRAPAQGASTIDVLGTASVSAAPDRAIVVLGAMTEGPDLQAIQAENAKRIASVIDSLIQLGVPKEQIGTEDYRIEPQYDYKDGSSIFRGYKVTQLLQIKTDQIGSTGRIVDTAVANGANTVSSVRFTSEHAERYEQQALSLAVRNAQMKASVVAQTIGIPLPPTPSLVEELSRTSEQPLYKPAMMAEAGAAATPIPPGQLTFSSTVRVKYNAP